MESLCFSCVVENDSNFNDLGLEIWIDSNKFYDNNIATGKTSIKYSFPEYEAEHILKIILKNKQPKHTSIDNNGKITDDATISIANIYFDDTSMDEIFFKFAKYTHNFNDTADEITEKFFGTLGCNGTVTFNFKTPFYMWLLEHL